jgi:hypothetical protein
MERMNDNCPICGLPIEVMVRFFADDPFIDGRTYDLICFTCASVPKTYDEDETIVFEGRRADKLCTPEDMIADGWTKAEATYSIKAVKRLLKNPKTIIVPDGGVNIFECLFMEIEI